MLEVVVLLMTYLIEYGLKKQKHHANVNVSLMKENVLEINGGITINVDVTVKNIIYVKKIIFEILPPVVVKLENI